MKYCQKCGKALDDEAVVCVNCGCAASPGFGQREPDVETSGLLIVLSVLFPIVGIIVGVIYMQSNNENGKKAGKTYLKAALITVGVVLIIYLFLGTMVSTILL